MPIKIIIRKTILWIVTGIVLILSGLMVCVDLILLYLQFFDPEFDESPLWVMFFVYGFLIINLSSALLIFLKVDFLMRPTPKRKFFIQENIFNIVLSILIIMTVAHLTISTWLQDVDEIIIIFQPFSSRTMILIVLYLFLSFYGHRESKNLEEVVSRERKVPIKIIIRNTILWIVLILSGSLVGVDLLFLYFHFFEPEGLQFYAPGFNMLYESSSLWVRFFVYGLFIINVSSVLLIFLKLDFLLKDTPKRKFFIQKNIFNIVLSILIIMTVAHLTISTWLQDVDEIIIILQQLSFATMILIVLYLFLYFYEHRESKTNQQNN